MKPYQLRIKNNGIPVTGLIPSWVFLKDISGGDISPQPVFREDLPACYNLYEDETYKNYFYPVVDMDGRVYFGEAVPASIRYAEIRMGPDDLKMSQFQFNDENKVLAVGSLVLPVMQGRVYTATSMQHREVRLVQGDTPRIMFDFGADYSGWEVWFGAKRNPSDGIYVVGPKQGIWTDASKAQGYIPLDSASSDFTEKIYCQILFRNGSQIATPALFTMFGFQKIIDFSDLP